MMEISAKPMAECPSGAAYTFLQRILRRKPAGEGHHCMEFRQIRYALAVAKERSFTKAATRMSISQSAVSEQVKLLEDRIGFSLFRRTGRGIEPTERGRM